MKDGEHRIEKVEQIHSIDDRIAVYFNKTCHHIEKQKIKVGVDTVLVKNNQVIGVVQRKEQKADISEGIRGRWVKVKEVSGRKIYFHDTWDKVYFPNSEIADNYNIEKGDWIKTGYEKVKATVKPK